jgi:hypothetical protein
MICEYCGETGHGKFECVKYAMTRISGLEEDQAVLEGKITASKPKPANERWNRLVSSLLCFLAGMVVMYLWTVIR